MSECAVVWCDREAVARGLCKRCYSRYRAGLSPNAAPRSYTTPGARERLRPELIRRRESGEGIADIAAATGVGVTALGRWFKEWGVDTPERYAREPNSWKRWTAEDVEFALSRTDLTVAERAAALGRSVSGVNEAIRGQRRT